MGEQKPIILLVDDEKDFREILITKLKAAGFDIAEAGNGEEGVRKAKEVKPDLILLDLNMPVMNGAETLLRIKSDPELESLKIVFLTNYGEPREEMAITDDKFAQEVGALDYIRKTDDLNKIIEEIKKNFYAPAAPNPNN